MGLRKKSTAKTWWGCFLVVSSILLVLICTLFPFKFFFRPIPLVTVLYLFLDRLSGVDDLVANVLLFVPLGLGLALLLQQTSFSMRTKWLLAIGCSFGLTFTVETLQLFLPSRDPSLIDLLTNTSGGVLAFYFLTWKQPLVFNRLHRLAQLSIARPSLKLLAAGFAGYLAIVGLGLVLVQNASELTNWDASFPLLLGNERTGDRPWQGSIADLYIADRAISNSEIAQVLAGKAPASIFQNSLLAAYQLQGGMTYPDLTGNLPPLTWEGSPPNQTRQTGVPLSADRWLTTHAAATPVNRAVQTSSQFTVITTLASSTTAQQGPARAISISADPSHRNLTIGQEGSDLVVRLRTPTSGKNGASPAIVYPSIFQDTASHRLIISYNGSALRLVVDNAERVYTQLTTRFTILSHLLSDRRDASQQGRLQRLRSSGVYYLLLFMPLGYLLAIAERRTSTFWVFACTYAVLAAVLFEVVLAQVSQTPLMPENLLLSATITLVTMRLVSDRLLPSLRAAVRQARPVSDHPSA